MRIEGQRESENIEDRRGMGPARLGGKGGLGIGTIVLALAVSYFTGANPLTILNLLTGVQSVTQVSAPSTESGPVGAPGDQLGKFASVVLADTETTWRTLLGPRYEDPRMVLFSGAVQSACGTTSSAVGPFYCPNDHRVYLDLAFFDEMAHRLGAAGDFAQAYVIAHEVGHMSKSARHRGEVHRLQRQAPKLKATLCQRMEPADCCRRLGHHAKRTERSNRAILKKGSGAAAIRRSVAKDVAWPGPAGKLDPRFI